MIYFFKSRQDSRPQPRVGVNIYSGMRPGMKCKVLDKMVKLDMLFQKNEFKEFDMLSKSISEKS